MNVDQRVPSVENHRKNCKGKRKKDDPLKVVYISSPMKVKTSAPRFRSLVQHLTGKNSDISQYTEGNNHHDFYEFDYDGRLLGKEKNNGEYQTYNSSISPVDTPTSSDSCLRPADSVFASEIEGNFLSNSFYGNLELDALGSFDEFNMNFL